jgi:hypothetical protein
MMAPEENMKVVDLSFLTDLDNAIVDMRLDFAVK